MDRAVTESHGHLLMPAAAQEVATDPLGGRDDRLKRSAHRGSEGQAAQETRNNS